MTVFVALLRGINVGGRASLPMADLRGVAEALGYGDVRTYIQSGNLLVTTSKSAATVARELERGIAELGGPTPDVAVRTVAQVAKLLEDSPFPDADPDHLHVAFLVDPKDRPTAAELDALARDEGEDVVRVGHELHLLLPYGVGRSKLAVSAGRRKAPATMRNRRTVAKLVELGTAT